MIAHKLMLSLLRDELAVCHLTRHSGIPGWVIANEFYAVTRSPDEVSVVCSADSVPDGVKCEKGWRGLYVHGPLDFSLTGVLASLAVPLAEADISIFALSTYNTDYVLVKDTDLDRALDCLRAAGHSVA